VQILQSPLALIAVLALISFLVYATVRIGPAFMIKRLAGLVFVGLGVTFVTFVLGLWGGGPNGVLNVNGQCGVHCTSQVLFNLENLYGLRDPWYVQYWHFLSNLAHGSLGVSYYSRERTVNSILASGVPISVDLQVEAISLELIIGIPLGILAALRAGTRIDTATMGAALVFYSMPSYLIIVFFDVIMVWLAQRNLPHLPVQGWNGPFSITAIAPVMIIAVIGMAYFSRLTRTNLIEVMGQDYVRTARAKGLRERTVIYRHAMRTALIPLITALGPTLAFSVAGAYFTETLMQIPGIGNISVTAIGQRDLAVIQGTVLIVAIAVVIMNLVADVTYGILDPRIKVA
jgi:ABC-type dipeptide/oligopeptide/nickel transport system permease component